MMDIPARRIGRGVTVGLGAAAVAFASAVMPIGAAAAAEPGDEVTLMTFNDFHGALGGARGLVCAVETVRSETDAAFLFSAGDNVGGSAFASAVQNDEPTIDVLNAMGVDASAIGNHEYDQGVDDLTGRIEDSADFPYLAANVYDAAGNRVHDAYEVIDRDGVKVAIVGAVTTKTVGKVSPAAIEGLEFGDPVDAVNDVVAEMEAEGVEYDVLVASYHEGASANAEPGVAPANTDPIFDKIVTETSPEVDAIFNGDSHRAYNFNAQVPGQDGEERPIIQTGSSAAFLGTTTLALGEDGDWDVVGQPALIDATLAEADEEEGTPREECGVTTDTTTEVEQIAADAIDQAAVVGADPVGSVAGDVTTSWDDTKASYVDGIRTADAPVENQATTKGDNRMRHSAAGDMLADSMKWYLEDAGLDGEHEVIGFMNPGGIRAELWYEAAGAEGDGVVTYAEANSMVPFGNTLNSGEVTGAQFIQMLEEQWQRTADGGAVDSGDEPFLAFAVSDNVEYVFDSTRERDDRIVEVRIDGEPIDPEGTYTIVTASFLFEGGDNMWTLSQAANVRDSGVLDRDAFIQYLEANPDLTPDYSQRQLELQILDGGEYDSEAGIDRDPVLRIGNVESQSLGAPEIESVVVDAGEYGTFEAPYTVVEDTGRLFADVTLTDWLCVPEGTVVPLTITAVPETGTEIVTEIGSFTWTSGGAPDECAADDGDDATPPAGDEDDATPPADDDDATPPAGDDDATPPADDGDASGDDADDASSDDTVVTPVDNTTSGDTTADGSDRSDLARTGVSLGSLIATISLVTLAGAGALVLRHRMSQR